MIKVDTIYLDNAATTFPKPTEVKEAVYECLCKYSTNPRRGNNPLVKIANEKLEKTRFLLAKFLGASSEQFVFIPSATYGINIVMQGTKFVQDETLYISPFEHNAVARCAEHLKKEKCINVRMLAINKDGTLDIEETERWFATNPPKLVVIVHANNVTGDILPIKEVTDLAHRYGGKVLIDAAQTVGLHTPRLDTYNYDYLAFSSHKGLYGIPGSGGLIIKDGPDTIEPLIYGGTGINSEDINMPLTLPERFEAGTFSLPAIVSMLAGIRWLEKCGRNSVFTKVDRLRQQLVAGLSELSSLGVQVIGQKSIHGNVGTVSLTVAGISPQEINRVLDSEGLCVRSGLHCAPLAHKTLGTFPNGTVRVSPAFFNTEEDVNKLLKIISALCY